MRMPILPRLAIATLLSALLLPAGAAPQSPDDSDSPNAQADHNTTDDQPLIPSINIDYTKYVLDNGLTLIVHEDHSTPIVAESMWYHVGSKNEGAEQHGFAHLFEHLMFQGTEHWHGEYFEPFEKAGATHMNGTTGVDRTNYYATVPTPALDMALWMESDRMGHLLGGIDKGTLKEQVGVVLNEKRQDENRPYGSVWQTIPGNTYPQGHPYSWPTIGSAKDLKAATLDNVHDWFKQYYGPSNATLVLAGDIAPKQALKKVKHYFGDIPAGPPLTRQTQWVAPMTGEHRMTMRDHVPHARLYMIWNVPSMDTPAATRLQLAADLLSGAKNSALYKKLVYDDDLALDVNAGLLSHELGSQFIITATAKPDVPLAKVESELRQTLQQFLQQGPSQAALKRSKTRIAAGFMRGLESDSGKAQVLARGQIYHNDPGHYQKDLKILRQATPADIRDSADKWLHDGVFVLSVKPFGSHKTHATHVDRSQLPDIGPAPDLKLPTMEQATLSNGLKIRLAEQHETPIVDMNLVFNAGYAADPEDQPGLASMTMAMLDEGAGDLDSLQINAALDGLGATLSASSSLDSSEVSLSALTSRLPESLALYADIVRHPTFPERAFKRLQKQTLAQIAQEKSTPTQLALRKLGPLLYGHDNAYGIPLTGSGTSAAVTAMTPQDTAAFAHKWLRPDNATLVIVGDTTMAQIKPMLEHYFGDWQAPKKALPKKDLQTVSLPQKTRVFMINRPGATQTTIIAGNVAPPKANAHEPGMTTVNAILGGMFNSRLNMTLREEKHWSYGAGSVLLNARGQQPFFAYTSVQSDKTAPSMQIMHNKIKGIVGDQPPKASELAMASADLTRSLPGHNETIAQLMHTFTKAVVFNLPSDYYANYVKHIQELTPDELETAARQMIKPDAMTWIVVGDLKQIGAAVRKLDWADVSVLDERPTNSADSEASEQQADD